MMKAIIGIFLFILISVFTIGCSSSKVTGKSNLETSNWQLDSLNGKKIIREPDQKPVTLNFISETHKINGSGGCNSFFGTYADDGSSLAFSGIGSTKMACDDMTTETDFFSALGKVNTYKITGSRLYLFSTAGIIMVLQKN
jgi:heat shock protein HslJ